jgi:hypothetical protein
MALRRERHPRHRSQFVREEAAAGLHESRVIRRNRRRARRWFDGWRRVGGGAGKSAFTVVEAWIGRSVWLGCDYEHGLKSTRAGGGMR